MNQETVITVLQGQEYRPRVESVYQENTFFYDSYRQAAMGLKEILSATEQFKPELPADWSVQAISDAQMNQKLMGYPNNVLAFCAERGQGKTSAMLSFAKALQDENGTHDRDEQEEQRINKFWGTRLTLSYTYEPVTCIDPTTMEAQDSILKVILSRMFSHFQDEQKKKQAKSNLSYLSQDTDDAAAVRDLLHQFRVCFHSLELLKESSKLSAEEDDLEQIAALGDSSNLRGMLCRLIHRYLKFVTGRDNSFLVLQIDDADLNIDQAYNIIEDIRKYLFMPHVIVLMAVNMRQMEGTVEQYFLKKYSTELKQKGSMVDVETCHDIAERYIDKVLPGVRQINLPELDRLLQEDRRHIRIEYKSAKEPTDLLPPPQETWHYQEQLLNLLHKKTGMCFLAPDDRQHELLPGTMRELTHFLNYFHGMDDVEADYAKLISDNKDPDAEKKIQVWLQNLERLERYLMDIWAPINLREEGRRFLSLLSREPSAHKNEQLLRFLPEYYGHEMENAGFGRGISTKKAEEYSQDFIQKCNPKLPSEEASATSPSALSYLEVCEALYILTELPGSGRQYPFAYAIHLYYSIYLHKLLLTRWPSKDVYSDISDFLGDILFQPDRVNYTSGGLTFGRFAVNGSFLAKLLTETNLLSNQPAQTVIASLCRRDGRTKHGGSKMCAIQSDRDFRQELEGRTLTVDMFYPVFYGLDVLFRAKDTDETEQVWLADSLCVLLNWDVQDRIRSSLKSQTTPWVSTWLHTQYNGISDQFKSIEYAPGPRSLIEHPTLKAAEKDESGVLFAVQISNFDFLHQYLQEVEKALKDVHQVLQPTSKRAHLSNQGLEHQLTPPSEKATALRDLNGRCKFRSGKVSKEYQLKTLYQSTTKSLKYLLDKLKNDGSSVQKEDISKICAETVTLFSNLDAYCRKMDEEVQELQEAQKLQETTEHQEAADMLDQVPPQLDAQATPEETAAPPAQEEQQSGRYSDVSPDGDLSQ